MSPLGCETILKKIRALPSAFPRLVETLEAEGITALAAAGYCFGGRSVFDLAFENIIKAVSHPSLLKVPEDLEKYLTTSKISLFINLCTVDQRFPLELSAKADDILEGDKFAPGYKSEYFEGCTYEFSVRGDMTNAKVKAFEEGAFTYTAEWFLSRL